MYHTAKPVTTKRTIAAKGRSGRGSRFSKWLFCGDMKFDCGLAGRYLSDKTNPERSLK